MPKTQVIHTSNGSYTIDFTKNLKTRAIGGKSIVTSFPTRYEFKVKPIQQSPVQVSYTISLWSWR